MIRKNHIVKINLPGGIVSAGDLYTIVAAGEKARAHDIQFGTRQQLILKIPDQYISEFMHEIEQSGIFFEVNNDQFPNIISSYVTENVFGSARWLSEGVYKDILDCFDYKPRLKINLVDGDQTFVPFFTGNINFISSGTGNYWYLYIRFPKTKTLYRWKGLVYSQDIPRISKAIEEVIFQHKDIFYAVSAADGNALYSQRIL